METVGFVKSIFWLSIRGNATNTRSCCVLHFCCILFTILLNSNLFLCTLCEFQISYPKIPKFHHEARAENATKKVNLQLSSVYYIVQINISLIQSISADGLFTK